MADRNNTDENRIFSNIRSVVTAIFGSSSPDDDDDDKKVEHYLGLTPEEQGISPEWLRPMRAPTAAPSVDINEGLSRK